MRVCPTFRPDKTLAIDSPAEYNRYLRKLGDAAGVDIIGYDDLLTALERRHEFFHKNGCRMADHGLETVYADETTRSEATASSRACCRAPRCAAWRLTRSSRPSCTTWPS